MTASEPEDGKGGEEELSESMLTMIGAGNAIIGAVAFTAVGWFVFEDIVYGGIMGLLMGIGGWLFLPWFLKTQAQAGEEGSFTAAARRVDESARLGVIGIGLEMGAVLMFVAGFLVQEPDPVIGVAVGFLPAAITYTIGSFVFDY